MNCDCDNASCGDRVSLEEVDFSTERGRSSLSEFWNGIYAEAFSVEDERESLGNALEELKASAGRTDWRFHLIVARDDECGKVVGGIAFDWFAASNSLVVEFLAVGSRMRRNGVGARLWRKSMSAASADSTLLGDGKPPRMAFCEAESPCRARDDGHLRFWSRLGFRRLGFDYIQPSLGPGKSPVRGLWLLCLPMASADTAVSLSVEADEVRSMLSDYVRLSMRIERPSEDGVFAEMDDRLSSTKRLPLLDALEADEDEPSVRHLASRIVWDGGRTEDDEGSPLPSEAIVDVPSSCRDVEFYLADWLGNTYGVSTSGFDYRRQREKNKKRDREKSQKKKTREKQYK